MAKRQKAVVEIEEVKKGYTTLCVIGTSPIILNRMSEKVKRELLLPKGRKTAAERKNLLKHDPIEEYRASPYRMPADDAQTYLGFMASGFKGAMRNAAVDIPGSSKAQIGRLVYVEGDYVPLFGVPKLHMSVTRQAGINRTPDIRTRAIIPRWAAMLNISYVEPIMTLPVVINLLAAGGIISGVGDWRPEKGKGDYGQFAVVNADDKELLEIMKTGGRDAQIAAMESPEMYDPETAELFSWFEEEIERRGIKR